MWVGPKSNVRDRRQDTQERRRPCEGLSEAETGVRQPQAKECLKPLEAGRGKEWILP